MVSGFRCGSFKILADDVTQDIAEPAQYPTLVEVCVWMAKQIDEIASLRAKFGLFFRGSLNKADLILSHSLEIFIAVAGLIVIEASKNIMKSKE